MTRHEINELFQKRSEAWALRDAGALARTHSENGVVRSPMFGELHGREAIAGSYASLFRMFPDWTFHEDALVIDGDQVVQPFSPCTQLSRPSSSSRWKGLYLPSSCS